MLLAASAPASAGPPANPQASCGGAITTYEATQLAPGSIGLEVSGLARSAPGLGTAMVSPLAHEHGSIEACVAG
jgi:hypothetical protein